MSSTKRFFEIVLIILAAFLVISIVFLGFSFGFKLINSVTGNTIYTTPASSSGILTWIVTTIFATLALFYVVRFLVHKDFLEIRGKMSQIEVDY